jgi:hypothetical protein
VSDSARAQPKTQNTTPVPACKKKKITHTRLYPSALACPRLPSSFSSVSVRSEVRCHSSLSNSRLPRANDQRSAKGRRFPTTAVDVRHSTFDARRSTLDAVPDMSHHRQPTPCPSPSQSRSHEPSQEIDLRAPCPCPRICIHAHGPQGASE